MSHLQPAHHRHDSGGTVIPAGVNIERDLLSASQVAQRLGLKRLKPANVAKLPRALSRPRATPQFWYAPHIEAHLSDPGSELPELPQWTPASKKEAAEWRTGAPGDLLDGAEVVTYLHSLGLDIALVTWVDYVAKGYAPAADAMVFDKAHWYRSTVKSWLANRPGKGAGAGRRPGSKDRAPRKVTLSAEGIEARQLIHSHLDRQAADAGDGVEEERLTDARLVAEVIERTDLSEAHVYRLLHQVQAERSAAALAAQILSIQPDLTEDAAVEVLVSRVGCTERIAREALDQARRASR